MNWMAAGQRCSSVYNSATWRAHWTYTHRTDHNPQLSSWARPTQHGHPDITGESTHAALLHWCQEWDFVLKWLFNTFPTNIFNCQRCGTWRWVNSGPTGPWLPSCQNRPPLFVGYYQLVICCHPATTKQQEAIQLCKLEHKQLIFIIS